MLNIPNKSMSLLELHILLLLSQCNLIITDYLINTNRGATNILDTFLVILESPETLKYERELIVTILL